MTTTAQLVLLLSALCIGLSTARLSFRAPSTFTPSNVAGLKDVLVGSGDNGIVITFEDEVVNNENDLFYNLEDQALDLAAGEWIVEWDVNGKGVYDLADQAGQIVVYGPNGTMTDITSELSSALGINASAVPGDLAANVQNITNLFENTNNGVINGSNVSTAEVQNTFDGILAGVYNGVENAEKNSTSNTSNSTVVSSNSTNSTTPVVVSTPPVNATNTPTTNTTNTTDTTNTTNTTTTAPATANTTNTTDTTTTNPSTTNTTTTNPPTTTTSPTTTVSNTTTPATTTSSTTPTTTTSSPTTTTTSPTTTTSSTTTNPPTTST